MVHKPFKPSQIALIAVSAVAVIIVGIVVALLLTGQQQSPTNQPEQPATSEPTEPSSAKQPIDLQFAVDQWTSIISGTAGVMIYDLDNKIVVARHNENESFNIASLYKLFVMLEGYLRIARGQWSGDEPYLGNWTRLKCLNLMISESNSPCAEKMWGEIGKAELDEIYRAKGFGTATNISSITSTPAEILKLMQLIWQHAGLNEEYWSAIRDSLLIQPTTTHNWRQGLPSGFSNAKVYNKVGWYSADGRKWSLYHDAAFVEFPDLDRHYIVVVLTKNVSPNEIVRLGRNIEAAVLVGSGAQER